MTAIINGRGDCVIDNAIAARYNVVMDMFRNAAQFRAADAKGV